VDDKKIDLKPETSNSFPRETRHRLAASDDSALIILELAFGDLIKTTSSA